MPSRFGVAAIAALALVAASFPAAAEGWNGLCTANVHFSFSAPVTIGGNATAFSMSGNGTCVASGLPAPVAIRTIALSASGSAASARCAPLLLSGSFLILFSTGSPPSASGIFSMNGTASGGLLLLNGAPAFTGLGVAVGAGLVDCASGGATALNFTWVFPFVDP